jgi:hypothetical protein
VQEFKFPASVIFTGVFFQFAACSLGLSATSQQYFCLRTNQPTATSQQYSSLTTNQHQPSATSQPNKLLIDVFAPRSCQRNSSEF